MSVYSARVRNLIASTSGKAAPDDDGESLFESGLIDSFALPDLVGAL